MDQVIIVSLLSGGLDQKPEVRVCPALFRRGDIKGRT
jgi:hypothetical protein